MRTCTITPSNGSSMSMESRVEAVGVVSFDSKDIHRSGRWINPGDPSQIPFWARSSLLLVPEEDLSANAKGSVLISMARQWQR